MSGNEINAVLAWLHIVSSIGWMGSSIFFTMVLGPLMRNLTPPTRAELSIKLTPKVTRFIGIFAILTIVFGVALVLSITKGNLDALAPRTIWGIAISAGGTLTVIAIVLGFGVATPASNKMVKIVQGMQSDPKSTAMAEMPKLQKRLATTSIIILALQFAIVAMMVAAAKL